MKRLQKFILILTCLCAPLAAQAQTTGTISGRVLDAVLALIDNTDDPVTQRDLHRLIARAGMFFNFPPELALQHLLIADEFGGLQGTLGADQLVQIGELAIDQRQPELSAHYYERLREEYPVTLLWACFDEKYNRCRAFAFASHR